MKIKTSFVTNSSSTSFLIIVDDQLEQEPFMKLMGVKKESELYSLAYSLYQNIADTVIEINEAYTSSRYYSGQHDTFEEFVVETFSQEVFEKVKIAQRLGKKAYIGDFSSDEEPFLSFVCCECFIEENQEIYFNYTNSSW